MKAEWGNGAVSSYWLEEQLAWLPVILWAMHYKIWKIYLIFFLIGKKKTSEERHVRMSIKTFILLTKIKMDNAFMFFFFYKIDSKISVGHCQGEWTLFLILFLQWGVWGLSALCVSVKSVTAEPLSAAFMEQRGYSGAMRLNGLVILGQKGWIEWLYWVRETKWTGYIGTIRLYGLGIMGQRG